MSEWKRVKLRDCVEEIDERTTENNQYEVLTSSKSGIYSQEDYFDKQVASKDNTGYKIIKRGQFTYRSMSDNGTFTINRLENKDIGIVSPAYPVFEAISINPEYLKYFFQSEGFRKAIYNLSQGSTRTALKYKDLSNIEILLPPIDEQEKIVKILKNIDYIIEKYEEVLKEKDKFIKTKFVEMFGNIDNSKFCKEKIKNLVDRNIVSVKKTYNKEDVIEYIDISSIDKEKHIIDLTTKYIVKNAPSRAQQCLIKNDILLSTVRPNLKNIAILKNCIKNAVGSSGFCILRCNKKCNYQYLFNVINTDKFTNDMVLKTTGSNYPAIKDKDVLEYFVPVPPIELQNQFAEIVKQIDKQKLLLEKQKQNYEKLKKGLMQKLLTGKVKVKI